MSDPDKDAAASGSQTELMAVILLGTAALASSYSGFQSEVWDGRQAEHYTLAEQARTNASSQTAVATELRTLDAELFSQWLDAYARNDERLQLFYRTRFRPQFAKVFEEWMLTHPATNPNAPLSPFHMNSYSHSVDVQATQLKDRADREYSAGKHADEISNKYVQGTVVFALTLFLGGITQAFASRKLRLGLLTGAAIFCVLGLVRIITLPALRIAV